MRIALLLFSTCLLLSTCGDPSADDCIGMWAAASAPQTIPNGPGVNVHFTDPKPGEIEMIATAGFRWVRMDFKWDVTERERGVYDFSAYDRLLTALESRGVRALFILDYGNPLYTDNKAVRTGEARTAFVRWSVSAAKHFQNRGVLWEIFNEPNNEMFWPPRPDVDEYTALALAVGKEFRSQFPSERLIGPATAGIDFSFLESCFKAGLLEYWSAVSIHPYRKSDPETAAAEYCRLRRLIQKYQPPGRGETPIISGEWGYSSVWRDMSEEAQAKMIARAFLTNTANRIPISIWYDWRDDGTNPNEAEHHFGLVRHEYRSGEGIVYEPKPAYQAAKTANSFLKGYVFEKRVWMADANDYVLVFSKDGDRRIAAWTTSSKPHRINLAETGSYSIMKCLGDTAGLTQTGENGIVLEISDAPIYLSRP